MKKKLTEKQELVQFLENEIKDIDNESISLQQSKLMDLENLEKTHLEEIKQL